jgi:hypothetical protein
MAPRTPTTKTPTTKTPTTKTSAKRRSTTKKSQSASTPTGHGFQVTHAVVTTTDMSKNKLYDLTLEHGSELTLSVTELKSKHPHQGVFKCRPTTTPTSVFMLLSWSAASANGKLLNLKITSTPTVKRIDGALLPIVATNLLEQDTARLALQLARCTLHRESESQEPFIVHITCNGKRMKVPCVVFAGDGEGFGSAVFVASEGPLRGMPLLVRHDSNAMRVTVVDGREVAA